ncbi:MAG: glycosyltransferase, partial [Planctomycetota bacterium]|nr:glycosyltransferase [Planctomycetota bacterium]
MRRLAVVVDTFPRWSERFIARELQELLRRGVDFTVFCVKAGDPLRDDDDWRGLLERRVVLPAALIPKSTKALAPDVRERWEQARESLGLSGYRQLGRAFALRDRLRAGGFGHAHAHFANLPSTLCWLAAADAKLPFSFSVHARDLFIEPQLLDRKLADCVRVFTCHARAQDFIVSKTSQTDKVRLMHHGLPLEQFPFKARAADSTARIVAAGRFVPKKGFDLLIEAAAQPVLASRTVTMTLLGEGPERKDLAARIRRLQLERTVVLQAPLGGAALRSVLDGAGLFVAPYRTAPDGDADGVPNVVLEAFALGIPVVGTDAGSLSEILTDETGTLVAQGDPAALA